MTSNTLRRLSIPLIGAFFLFTSCNLLLFNGHETPASPSKRGEGADSAADTFDKTSTVTNLRGSEGKYTDKIRVTWNEVPGASYYTILRANLGTSRRPSLDSALVRDADFEQVGISFIPSFEDKAVYSTDRNTFYAYKVTATSLITDQTTSDSPIVYGSFLTAPDEISVGKGESEDKITITFAQTPGTSQYLIYKSENSNDLANLSHVASLNDFVGLDEAIYEYRPSPSESGKNLYFAIRASSSDGTLSDISESRVGYTLVPGSPGSINVASNTKGERTDGITVSFDPATSSSGDVNYKIYKSFAGGAETLMIDTEEDGFADLQMNDLGELFFVDDSVSANVIYNYNIIPSNDIGIGKSIQVSSYVLSPARKVDLKPVVSSDKFGYELDITPPVGFGEDENIQIEVTSTLKDGTVRTTNFSSVDSKPFYNVNPSSETDDEIRSVSVTVKNVKSDFAASAVTASVSGIPSKPEIEIDGKNIVLTNSEGAITSVAATQCSGECSGEKYQNGTKCHEIGAYPIIIGWKKSDNAYQYRLKRSDGKAEFVETSKLQIQDKRVEVGKTYDYILTAEDKLGRNAGEVKLEGCFAAITHAQFSSEYERHIAKPFYFQDEHPEYAAGASKGAIWSYIRKEGTGSLGSASATDSFLGARIDYSAVMSGVAGKVTFTYHPGFGECSHMHMVTAAEKARYGLSITEPQNVSFTVGLSGDGDYTPNNSQKHYIGGLYGLAIVDANNIETKSKLLSGRYQITLTYRKADGTEFTKTDTASPLSYKVAN